MDLQARIGRRLAELREKRGLTPHQLAKEIGVTSQFVGRLESGERAPSLKVLADIAKTLKVEPAELLRLGSGTGDGDPEEVALPIAHLLGAARRLNEADLTLLLDLARRLGRSR